MIDDLEKQLKSALEREAAPEWFEARVMNAVTRQVASRSAGGLRWTWISAVATAAAVVFMSVGWEHHRMVEERAAGEAAKAKLVLALRITSAKLAEIQQRVDEAQRND